MDIKDIIMHYQSEYDDNDNIGKLKQYYKKIFHELYDMKNSNLLQGNDWEDVYKRIFKQKACT